jgi:hypothetical protein
MTYGEKILAGRASNGERCECTGPALNAGLAQRHDKKPVR